MGDTRRFHLFSEIIAEEFPLYDHAVADVAGGKGYLQAALRQLGFSDVTSWDTRNKYAANRRGYRYGWFNHDTAPAGYNLVVGMHPDEGTDHIIRYAAKHRVPFCVCPCCIKPSADAYWNKHTFGNWVDHLIALAAKHGMAVETRTMKMRGRNLALVGRPPVKE